MTFRRLSGATLAMGVVMVLTISPAAAKSPVSLQARLDGAAAAGSKDSHPVSLSARSTPIDLTVTNGGTSPVVVHTVRLSSSVLGVNFFTYETEVEISVAPGATENRQFTLDLSALKGQATGLLPASISLLDAHRQQVAAQPVTVDVHGSNLSVYSIFGVVLLLLTVAGVVGALLALMRHTLSANRFLRGIRFLIPGIGIGLVVVIGFSLFSVFSPRLSRWGPIVVITALAMFAVGYFTPTPDADDEGEIAPEEAPAHAASAAAPPTAAPAPARNTAPPATTAPPSAPTMPATPTKPSTPTMPPAPTAPPSPRTTAPASAPTAPPSEATRPRAGASTPTGVTAPPTVAPSTLPPDRSPAS
ncbi:MAG: hypothetical protein QOK39_2471 [Acidimicrobiaceae bacterium]|jgi:hypothetical protein|nr:hypothetical protein [Acidimicrobiaceae bacterium]